MTKNYRRTALREFVKDEILGIVFGFLAVLILKLFKEESPSSLFYIVPAVMGLVAFLANLLGNLKPFIRTDPEGITKFKFSFFGNPEIGVFLPWQKIKEIDLNLFGLGFLKYKIRLTQKSNHETLTADYTVSEFRELLKEVFSRATQAQYTEETKKTVSQFYKELTQLVPALSVKTT